MRRNLLALVALLFFAQAQAAVIEQPLPNPVQEQQARAIFRQLRCMVCEGQSLAESDATLAVQMRARIRDMLAHGETPDAILQSFAQSYGERILLAPPLAPRTWALWALPLVLLGMGSFLVWRATYRKDDV